MLEKITEKMLNDDFKKFINQKIKDGDIKLSKKQLKKIFTKKTNYLAPAPEPINPGFKKITI